MVYVAYNTDDQSFQTATNIRSLSEAIGIPYHTMYRQLKNGQGTVEFRNFVLGKSPELLKGNQRYHGDKTIQENIANKKETILESSQQDNSDNTTGVETGRKAEVQQEGTGVLRGHAEDIREEHVQDGSIPPPEGEIKKFDSFFSKIQTDENKKVHRGNGAEP